MYWEYTVYNLHVVNIVDANVKVSTFVDPLGNHAGMDRRSSDRTGSAPRRGPAEWQELPTNRLNKKMTVSVESVDADYSRQERWTHAKHGAYMKKAQDYSVFYYGSPSAREEKRCAPQKM